MYGARRLSGARIIRTRIGGVPYGVGDRLLTGLEDDDRIELSRDAPSRLIQQLRAGEIDAALASSVEAFRHPYQVVDHIGICSRGAVHSVRAFRRAGPIRTVGLDTSSETSVALLRVLLAGPLGAGADCTFERVAPTTAPDALPHDLVLMIGDCGLDADPGTRQVIDLGAAWTEWTGLPFVFAVWMIRPGIDAQPIAARLLQAREDARGLPRSEREAGVHYDVGEDERAGLRRFRDEVRRLGLVAEGVEPTFVGAAPTRPAGGGQRDQESEAR